MGYNKIMNDKEVSEIINWSPRTLFRRLDQGMLPSEKIGGRRYYSRKEIEYWLSVVKKGLRKINKIESSPELNPRIMEELQDGMERLKDRLPNLLPREHRQLQRSINKILDLVTQLTTKYDNGTTTTLD